MLYWKVRIIETKERYWIRKSKKLFRKYSKLNIFTYEYEFDFDLNEIWDDCITVDSNGEEKRYWVQASKKGYKWLRHMLYLELKINYKDTDS